tara:strand:- start:1664 stop:2533 length:870 start_codon:yes stop_codon:yes gene_type:complete
MIKYLSPSGLKLFEKDREEFYLNYVVRLEREPQTIPMAIGSAFDAYIKCKIAEDFDLEFDPFEKVFEDQVESHLRDTALSDGLIAYNGYIQSRAYDRLKILIAKADKVEMEVAIQAPVTHEGTTVTLMGKPDLLLYFDDFHYIHDWKVNGFYSKSKTSPKTCFVHCEDSWVGTQSKTHGTMHKRCVLVPHPLIPYDIHCMSDINTDWSIQLSIYSWIMGCGIGSKFLIGIDQLAGNPARVATFRNMANAFYQKQLWESIVTCWKACENETIIPASRAAVLDKRKSRELW